jgi:hypothetical protein
MRIGPLGRKFQGKRVSEKDLSGSSPLVHKNDVPGFEKAKA